MAGKEHRGADAGPARVATDGGEQREALRSTSERRSDGGERADGARASPARSTGGGEQREALRSTSALRSDGGQAATTGDGSDATFRFFGGKGGVGKTTVSAAFGLKCANAGLETLVVSTDPAHSTSDVFDQQFTDDPAPVSGYDRLHAMEIDPEEEVQNHLQDLREQLGEQLSPAMVNEVSMQLEMAHQTPGAYEAALFDRFIEVMQESDPYDRVVFDTSPTGGTLRLLALPEYLEQWIDRLLHKREKSIDYYEKAAIGEQQARRMKEGDPILARLRRRKERFSFAGETLRSDAAFTLVLNPDELSIRETSRAIDSLRDADLPVRGLVVNKLTPAPDPDEDGRGAQYLRDRVETERDRLAEIRETFAVPVVAEIETRVREVKGPLLRDVADELAVEPGAPARE